ncbi:MAG: hypothetical protein AB7S48_01090 [Bacteroidales bacterium]
MKRPNKYVLAFLVNNLLILTSIATIVSGFVLQLGFHIGNSEENIHLQTSNFEQLRDTSAGNAVWGIDYATWSAIHKVVIIFLSLLMVYHFAIHWKWYKGVFAKHLIKKNKQVIVLSFIFILVVLTGFIPWFIDLSGNRNLLRLFLIEVHDKISILLTVYLTLHVIKRVKWFSNTYKNVKR